MNVDTYYRRHQCDGPSVEAELIRLIGEIPRFCVCLSGSLIEGIGNGRSDLDAYVITDAPDPARYSFGNAQVAPIGDIFVDIEFIHPEKLEKLIARAVGFSAQALRDQRCSAVALTPSEMKLLHNISIATPVEGEEFLRDLQGRIDVKVLSRLLFDYCSVLMDAVHQDVMGFIEANDADSAKSSLRIYRQHVAGAFLAALGETNPAEKWRSVKMRQARERKTGHVLPGGRTIEEVVECWFDLDSSIATEACTQSLMQLSMLGNAIIPWGLQRFVDGMPGVGAVANLREVSSMNSIDRPGFDIPLPVIAYDCVVRRDEAGVWMSRFGSPKRLYLNQLGLETVLQFNGRKTMRGALNRLYEISDAPQVALERSVSDFHRILSSEKLVFAKGI
jgi:hypothetical protein